MPLIITVMFCCAVRTAHLTFNMFPDTKGIQVIWFHKFWEHFLWDLQNCPALIQQFYWSLYPSQNEDAFSVTLREHEPWVGTREADIYSWGKGLSVNLNNYVLYNFLKEGLCWQNAVASAPLTCWNGRFLVWQRVAVSEDAVFVRDTMRDSVEIFGLQRQL